MELLANACYIIIGFCIIMYVLLDGFDLGIGILFPLVKEHDKSLMMSAILPVWDGNQTWLVLGIAFFYGAFPVAFSMIMPALYLPLLIMVISLLLRGITFEFRLKEKKYRWIWNAMFFMSSIVITFSQGILLGAFVSGFSMNKQHQIVATLITPFNLTCGIALLFGYSLLGSTWIIAKIEERLKSYMYRVARISLWTVAFFLMVISLWSPFINNDIWERWFGPQNFYKVLFLPCFTAGLIVYFDYCLMQRYVYRLYWLAVLIFLCSYIGFGISSWPYIVPRYMTMWQAASPPSSQIFVLIGTLTLLPILVGYTAYGYYVFRGKVTDVIDYSDE
jgi:cytochrome d ubiquinol oxidase subunit II